MEKFDEILERFRSRRLSGLEAAEILGMSERTFRRYRRRHEQEGLAGLFDRRLGKASARAVPADRIAWMLDLYRTEYRGWTAKHFHEHLRRDHGFTLSYTWVKSRLQDARLLPKAPKRGAHRRKRPRKPCVGMMLHQDGSRHAWLAGRPPLDLIVTMDDATSEIYSAFLVEEEGTASTFRALRQVFEAKGLPCALYTDRGSHYFLTPKAGGKVDRSAPTQVGRALARLGVEHIAAYSPQARGRSERVFATLQDRLVKELAKAGITETGAANRFIGERYLPEHNRRFARSPELEDSAFVALARPEELAEILCAHTERVVGRDNTVRHRGRTLQIPPSPMRAHYVKARVRVHDYPDGSSALFHGPRRIADYDADGALLETEAPAKQAA
ncbi:MAG: ISNCY family transposase [Phycisphaerae bacterium]